MASDVSCTVELIGGPFDGHLEPFANEDDELPQNLTWPVNDEVIRELKGRYRRTNAAVTSVAIYSLGRQAGARCYRFVGAVSPNRLGLPQARPATRLWSLVRSMFRV